MSALAKSLRLARIDVTRTIRTQTDLGDGASSVLSLLMYAVFTIAGTVGGGYGAFRAGESLAAGETFGVGQFAAVEVLRGVLALFWLMFVLIFAIRAIGQRGTLAQPEGILTVVPTRTALVGVLLGEYAFLLLWFVLPAVGVGAGLALGTGVVWPVLAVPAAILGAALAAVAAGYPLGLGVRHVATRFPFVARNKGAIVVLAFLAYFAALSTGAWDRLMVELFDPMSRSPVGWFADLLLLGTPGVATATANAAGALALVAVLAAGSVVVGTPLADLHWFSDPALAGETDDPSPADRDGVTGEAEAGTGLDRRLAPVLGRPTAALVTLSWRRAVRNPLKLLYALYPLLFLVGIFADVATTGRAPAYLPYATVLFVAWAAGVVFTLNPLGDQGAALASTLLSRVDGQRFVRAHLFAGLVVAVPLGLLATAAVTAVSPLASDRAVAVVAAAPVVVVLATVLSVGVGMAFPRFEATNVTRSMKTVIPSRSAFVLFTLYLFLTAGAGAVVLEPPIRAFGAGLLSWVLPFGLSVSETALYRVSAVALVPLVAAPFASYRYAVRRFDRYTLS